MSWRLLITACTAAGVALFVPRVGAAPSDSDLQWLERLQSAPARTNYHGVFVYQQGDQVQSSRITHIADASGSRERLEVLDGQPREYLRHDDELRCLMPDLKQIVVERSGKREGFPALIQSSAKEIVAVYSLRRVGGERIAGIETDAIELTPRDAWRFGYRFWADRATGLPLKVQTVNEKGEVVEQIAFSEIRIGAGVDRSQLKTRLNTEGWRVENTQTETVTSVPWKIESPVPGFKKVREVRRSFKGHANVLQIVFSDGLAAVSVFIEPLREGQSTQETAAAKGAINMIGKRVGNDWITVLGEVPAPTLRQFANAVEAQPANAKP